MKPWVLRTLLVIAVACAAAGVAIVSTPLNSASFGWSAYSPLAGTRYQPLDPSWAAWTPRLGLALLALGAGSTGGLLVALVLARPSRNTVRQVDRASGEQVFSAETDVART